MKKTREVKGIKIASKVDMLSTSKRTIKQQKREEHSLKLNISKEFFATLENTDTSNITTDEKLDLVIECFKKLGPSLAHIENLSTDTTGNPFGDD